MRPIGSGEELKQRRVCAQAVLFKLLNSQRYCPSQGGNHAIRKDNCSRAPAPTSTCRGKRRCGRGLSRLNSDWPGMDRNPQRYPPPCALVHGFLGINIWISPNTCIVRIWNYT